MNFYASIIGRLAKDPALTTVTLKDGTTAEACHLRICVNDAYADKDEAGKPVPMWISVTAWKAQGTWIAANLHKGDQIAVTGHPFSWITVDKEGYCHLNTELRHPEFTFLSNGKKEEKKVNGPIKGKLPPKKGEAAPEAAAPETAEATDEAEEEVPL